MPIRSKFSICVALSSALVLASCASKPEDIEAAYVSPLAYEAYTCDQLKSEAIRVSERAQQAAGVQKKKATNDAVAVGVGVVLFLPALLFVKGSGATEGEIARLKGEIEAIEKASIQKNCNIGFQAAPEGEAAPAPAPTTQPG